MSWVKTLEFTPPPELVTPDLRGGPRYRRQVEIDGVKYPSINAAKIATGYSSMKIYYLMGEAWRNHYHLKKHRTKRKALNGKPR